MMAKTRMHGVLVTALIFALMLLTGNSSAQSEETKKFCEDAAGTIPLAIFGGVFWLPIGYVLSSELHDGEVLFIDGNWICGIPESEKYFHFKAGRIIVGQRAVCQGCDIHDSKYQGMRLIRTRSFDTVTVREFEVGDGVESVPVVLIFDGKSYMQIVGERSNFWESSLMSMMKDIEYIERMVKEKKKN